MPLNLSKQAICRIYASGAIVLWSVAFPVAKICLESFSPSVVSFIRFVFASLFLLAFYRSKLGLPALRDLPKFIAAGILGFSLYMTVYNTGIRLVTSATGAIIIATTPIITAIIALFLFREEITPRGFFAIALAFSGILTLSLWDSVFSIGIGILWLLFAAVLMAGYNISQRMLTKTYPPFKCTSYSIFIGTILLLFVLPDTVAQIAAAPISHTLWLAFLGVFSSAVAGLFWTKAISMANKTTDVTNFMFLLPLVVAISAFIISGEMVTMGTFLGGALIISGLVLFSYSRSSSPDMPSPAHTSDEADPRT